MIQVKDEKRNGSSVREWFNSDTGEIARHWGQNPPEMPADDEWFSSDSEGGQ